MSIFSKIKKKPLIKASILYALQENILGFNLLTQVNKSQFIIFDIRTDIE